MDRRHKLKRSAKAFQPQELPYSVDTLALAKEVPDLDRTQGVGRLVQDYLEAAQANFDHLNAELRRQALYHNEHVAETQLIRDEYEKHEHAEKDIVTMPGRSQVLRAGTAWSETGYETDDIYFWPGTVTLPLYIDKACTIERVHVWVAEPPAPYVAPYDEIHAAIWAGDNEGNMPGSLLADLGNVSSDTTNFDYELAWTCSVEVGPGWIWVSGGSVDKAANDPIYVHGMNTTGAAIGGAFVSNAWPFSAMYGDSSTGPDISESWLGLSESYWTFDTSAGWYDASADPPAWFGYMRPPETSFSEAVGGDFSTTQLVPTFWVTIS